jgi:hypothetical protein
LWSVVSTVVGCLSRKGVEDTSSKGAKAFIIKYNSGPSMSMIGCRVFFFLGRTAVNVCWYSVMEVIYQGS